MNQPLVSVVITAYNYAHLLPKAIESVLAQEYEPLELLVLDNASTDDTADVVARYAADPRLRSIRNETNIGLTPNHNKGLRESRGDFVLFLSADDALTPGCVARAMRYYDAHPEIDILYGSAYFMNRDGEIYDVRQVMGQPNCAYDGRRNELAALLSEGCYMCTPTMLVRRWIWETYGGFDESIHAADWEISARWAKAGLRFGYLPEPLAVVRIHPDQHSGRKHYVATGRDMGEYLEIVDAYLDAATPERYAGHEHAIRRLLESRDYWLRKSLPDVAGQFDADVQRIRERITSIGVANTARPRARVCYIVVVEKWLGPVEATLRTLLAQGDPAWRAVVLQQPGVSCEGMCRMLDPERIRHVQTVSAVTLGQMLNTALRVEDADIYTVLRAGTRIGPGNTAALKAVFVDPNARLAVAWPRFFVDPAPLVPGSPVFIEELSRPPVGAFDVLVGPEVQVEAFAFARELFDRLNEFNPTLTALVDWDFLIRVTLLANHAFRSYAGDIEVHLTPGSRFFSPTYPAVAGWIETLHREYSVNDPERVGARASYLARLQAALRVDQSTQEGLLDFYRTLARTGVSV